MVIVFKHFTFLFARSYNQNRANVYNLFIHNILVYHTAALIVHISYILVYDFLKLSKFHTSATVTPSEGVGKWRESATPSEGVEKHCSNGIASAGTVRRRCTKHGTLTPSEGVGKWRESTTPSEGVEKHCSDGIASACTVRRKCTKHGTRLLPKEWENGGKARLLRKEWRLLLPLRQGS